MSVTDGDAGALTLWASRPARPRRLAAAISAQPALVVAAITVAICWPALVVLHHKPVLALPRAQAVAAVKHSPITAPLLRTLHWTRADAVPIDGRTDSVWFYDGPRLRLAAIVGTSGKVQYTADPAHQPFAYGSNIANDARVLALLSVIFVLVTAVWPLWRLRNLDVLMAATSTVAIVLLNGAMLNRAVVAGALSLSYLGLRCAWRALGPARPPPPAVPLFDALTRAWSDEQRVRILRVVAVASGLILAMIGIGSGGVVDVGRAVMEGATDIVHGALPYGHIPGILHGDTYPIGSYLLYAPLAVRWPVRDAWDSGEAALYVAVLAVLAAAVGMWRGTRGPKRPLRSAAEPAALRLVIAWFTFPALLVTVTTGSTDAVLAAVLLAAIVIWQRPAAASGLLAAGAWFKLAPAALMPLALAPLRGRRLRRALVAIVAVSVAALAAVVALGGGHGVAQMWHAMAYQVSRVSPQAVWAVAGSVPLQPLTQALTLALVAAAAMRLRRQPSLAADRARVAALCAAVMIGLQLSAGYWTYMYVAWALPGVMLSLLWSSDESARR